MPDFELPVIDHEGNRLVELRRLEEHLITEKAARTPCPLSLVVITSHRGVLFGLNRWRQHWELPGGLVDPGETHRITAARELTEETGLAVPAEELEFVGIVTFELVGPTRHELAAVFRAGSPSGPEPRPSDELTHVRWLADATEVEPLSPVDWAISTWARAGDDGHDRTGAPTT